MCRSCTSPVGAAQAAPFWRSCSPRRPEPRRSVSFTVYGMRDFIVRFVSAVIPSLSANSGRGCWRTSQLWVWSAKRFVDRGGTSCASGASLSSGVSAGAWIDVRSLLQKLSSASIGQSPCGLAAASSSTPPSLPYYHSPPVISFALLAHFPSSTSSATHGRLPTAGRSPEYGRAVIRCRGITPSRVRWSGACVMSLRELRLCGRVRLEPFFSTRI